MGQAFQRLVESRGPGTVETGFIIAKVQKPYLARPHTSACPNNSHAAPTLQIS
jgi:hypothetical protein